MAASASFTLAGLCLGSSLIMLVAAVSDEFNSTSVSQVAGDNVSCCIDILCLLSIGHWRCYSTNLMRINASQ